MSVRHITFHLYSAAMLLNSDGNDIAKINVTAVQLNKTQNIDSNVFCH